MGEFEQEFNWIGQTTAVALCGVSPLEILAKYKLTPQEQRVVLLAMTGCDDHQIGQELGISRETVRVYWKRIRERTGHSKRAAIISMLMREAAESQRTVHDSEADLLMQEITRRSLVEDQIRAVLDGARDFAIFFMEPDRTITVWSHGAERIMGWTATEAIGQSADIVFTPDDRKRGLPKREAEEAARKGSASDVRWHVRKDGSRFWAVGSMNAIYFQDGTLRGFVKVFADETRLRELEENRSAPSLGEG